MGKKRKFGTLYVGTIDPEHINTLKEEDILAMWRQVGDLQFKGDEEE